MNVFQSHAPILTPPLGRVAISLEELAVCVRGLDPGSRALLDLSLRRRLPLEAMAGFLQTDPFDLARRRARAVARIAAELDLDGHGVIATVKAALARLPEDAWGVPRLGLPAPASATVQADEMADAARALMARLREQRQRAREFDRAPGSLASGLASVEARVGDDATLTGPEVVDGALEVADQPTIEFEALGPVTEAEVEPDAAEVEAGAGDEASATAERASLGAKLAEAEAEGAAEARVTGPGRSEAEAFESPDASDQPTVESEAIVLEPEPEAQDQPTVESEAIVLEPEPDADDQPTVESDALRPWPPAAPPIAATDMAAAFAQHPAFAVENDRPDHAAFLPPLAEALARAAASERAAAEIATANEPPGMAPSPASKSDRPAAPSTTPCVDERAPRRRLARGGILIGLLLALVRFLLDRR
jgi:hypothetical protein